jgi:dTMP kinase
MALLKFITFEGGEGSGKSTHARRLAERLRAAGQDVLLTREPGGTPFAERLRDLILDAGAPRREPISDALLFFAARADHTASVIAPALARGAWAVCDRFSDSTRVYQGIAGGVDPGVLEAIEALVPGSLRPTLTFIMDVAPAAGLARARARSGTRHAQDPYESRDLRFHERVRAGFLDIARRESGRCAVIDAEKDAKDVENAVRAAVVHRFGSVL